MKKQSIQINIFLAELLQLWENKGHQLDVRQHLNIQTFAQQLPEDLPLERLKSLLAPLLTIDEPSQQAFYQMFDEALPAFEDRMKTHEQQVKKLQSRQAIVSNLGGGNVQKPFSNVNQNFSLLQRRVARFFATMMVGVFMWMAYDYLIVDDKISDTAMPEVQRVFVETNILEEPEPLCLAIKDIDKISVAKLSGWSKNSKDLKVVEDFTDNGMCIYYQGFKEGRYENYYRACYENKCFDLIIHFKVKLEGDGQVKYSPGDFVVQPKIDTSTFQSDENISGLSSQNTLLDTSFMTQRATQAVEGVTTSIHFGGGFTPFTPLKGLMVGLFALFVFIGTYLYKRFRQRFSIHQNHPPELYNDWSIQIPRLKAIDFGLTFKNMLVAMRKRVESEALQLDMAATIEESIYQGGAINFQYKNLTQHQQYLALIDISMPDSHQTKLYTELVKALQSGDAPLDYFFFDKNTFRVWNARYEQGLTVKQLQHKFGDAQLFIFSDGQVFSSPKWLKHLEHWRRRVLLTPTPVENWSGTETRLKNYFRLLPANPLGFKMLVETLEAVEPKDYEILGLEKNAAESYLPFEIPENISSEDLEIFLEKEFIQTKNGQHNDKLMQWIAACSLPPTLFWEWTLHTGKLLSSPSSPQLTMENLLQINRLPWFKTGQFPEEVRTTLLFWLEKNHPNFLDDLHQSWGEILDIEENIPPVGSIAWQGHRIQVVLNELLQRPEKQRRKELEEELERLIADHHKKDALIIKYMEQRKSPLDALLSNRFRPFLQKQEPLFWRFRNWTWQMPSIGAFLIAVMLIHYNEPVTTFNFENAISELKFTHDGETFLVASGLSDLSVCAINGDFVQGTSGQRDNIVGLEMSADGQTILTGTNGNNFAHWDISGAPIFLSNGDSRVANDIAFHPNNEEIAIIGYYNNQAELWNLEEARRLQSFEHEKEVTAVAFSKNGKYILTGSRDKTIKLWNVNGKLLQVLKGHDEFIHTLAFSSDGQRIASGSRDNTAKIWDLEGNLLQNLATNYDVFTVEFTPDGLSLLTGGINKAKLWSVEKGQHIRTFGGHYGYVKSADFSADGQRLLTGDSNGKVRLWKVK